MVNNKNKLIIVLILLITLLSGVSYALWIYINKQDGKNVVDADCFELEYQGDDSINLVNAVPLFEEEGNQLQPYKFTITNICNNSASYQVNIESLSESSLSDNYVRAKIDSNESALLGNIIPNQSKLLDEARSSRELYVGKILAGESITHNLRLWLDEDAPADDSSQTTYKGKITVISTVSEDNHVIALNLNDGTLRENRIVSMVGKKIGDLPTPSKVGYDFINWCVDEELKQCITKDTIVTSEMTALYAKYEERIAYLDTGSNINSKLRNTVAGGTSNSIKGFERSDELKNSTYTISLSGSKYPVYVWYENEKIYYYSEATRIFLNFDCSYMFQYMGPFDTLDLADFDTSNVTKMYEMFYKTTANKIDLTNWNTKNVSDMSYMFYYANVNDVDVSSFDTSNLVNMSYMFYYSKGIKNVDISSWNKSNIGSMNYFIYGSELEEVNVSNWDFVNFNLSDGPYYTLFYGCNSLKKVIAQNNTNMNSMYNAFSGKSKLESVDFTGSDMSTVTSMLYMFNNCSKLTEIIGIENFNTSNVTNMSYMFYNTSSLQSINLSSWNTENVTTMQNMFASTGIKELDLSNFNTHKLQDAEYLISSSAVEVLNISNWDVTTWNEYKQYSDRSAYNYIVGYVTTSNLKRLIARNNVMPAVLNYSFGSNQNLEYIDFTGSDFSNVTSFYYTFYSNPKLTKIDGFFDNSFSSVTNMEYMFEYAPFTELDLSTWDTSNVTNMGGLFFGMTNLEKIYVGEKWNISSLSQNGGQSMFYGATNLVGSAGTVYNENNVDSSYAHIDGGVDNPGYFTDIADKPTE